jgi:hypothetical protein
MAIGTDFRWNTIRQLFITFPRRYDILVAKISVIALLIAAASLLSSVIATVIGIASDAAVGSAPDWLGLALRAVLALIGRAAIWFGLAGLRRGTIEAQPFDAFDVHPTSIAVYHLGNSGAARTLLKEWELLT